MRAINIITFCVAEVVCLYCLIDLSAALVQCGDENPASEYFASYCEFHNWSKFRLLFWFCFMLRNGFFLVYSYFERVPALSYALAFDLAFYVWMLLYSISMEDMTVVLRDPSSGHIFQCTSIPRRCSTISFLNLLHLILVWCLVAVNRIYPPSSKLGFQSSLEREQNEQGEEAYYFVSQ